MRTWVAFCLLLTAAFSIHAETRVALVSGNGAYEHPAHLHNQSKMMIRERVNAAIARGKVSGLWSPGNHARRRRGVQHV
jgi:hypothetical protein